MSQFVTVWPTADDFIDPAEPEDEFDAKLKAFGELDGVNSLAVKGAQYLHQHSEDLESLAQYVENV